MAYHAKGYRSRKVHRTPAVKRKRKKNSKLRVLRIVDGLRRNRSSYVVKALMGEQ